MEHLADIHLRIIIKVQVEEQILVTILYCASSFWSQEKTLGI